MKTLILISHGNFATGIKQSIEMIMGPLQNVYTVTLEPQEGPEDFKAKLSEIISQCSEKIVIFADLLGGTPCNVALSFVNEYPDIEIYTGLNLGMLIAFVNEQMLGQAINYVESGRESIVDVKELLSTMSDEDEE